MEKKTGVRVAFRGRTELHSPERGRPAAGEAAPLPGRRVMRVLKKVQVVYYLTRNGQLEQPHFMEVSHLADHQIRLKDFIDRLVVLRGRGMPSQYSWSCKRSYKNGFVWNDLTENDVIHPSEGAEYILKGSEIVLPCSAETERLDKRVQAISIAGVKPRLNSLIVSDEEEGEEFDGSNGQICRCSKGVNGSTRKSLSGPVECPDDDGQPSPQSTASTLSSEKGERGAASKSQAGSRRFAEAEEGDHDPAAEVAPGRGSVLLQLIACGGAAAAKGKGIPCLKQQLSRVEGRVSNVGGGGGGGLRREVVCRAAAVAAGEEEEMIKYMSENPRFGNLQSEEKEYFSGSILEAMNDQGRAQVVPCLKKSSSYKEERSIKAEIAEESQKKSEEAQEKSKCIPNPIRRHCRQSRT